MSEPVSIRYKNPGAMWGNALAIKWGAQKPDVQFGRGVIHTRLTPGIVRHSPAIQREKSIMSASSYPVSIKNVLAHEGGYTNHPADPGGPTNWGITIFDARKYWKPNATAADVKAMPLSVAQDIYRKRYWNAQRCDDLPPGLDYSVFDYGVNSGIGRSGKVLRRLVGLPDNTSVVTQEVIDAVRKRDPKQLIAGMNDERLRFLKSLKTWPTFGGGWGRRVAEVKALSLQMASGAAPSAVIVPAGATEVSAKGTIKPPPIAGAVVGTATAGVGGVAVNAGSDPHAGPLAWMAAHPGPTVFIGIALLLVTIGICEFFIRRHERKTETPMPGTEAVPPLAI